MESFLDGLLRAHKQAMKKRVHKNKASKTKGV